VLVQVGDDTAVLARAELAEPVNGQHQISFGDLQSSLEAPGVPDFVHAI
jgi:hypothetical protein